MLKRIRSQKNNEARFREHFLGIITLVWTVTLAASLLWNLLQVNNHALEMARIQAQVAFDKDVLYRRWNAEHGGVYVWVTEETQPNPYLTDIEARDITTPFGMLTLLNPAYMTRQVHELAKEEHGTLGHITSLNPIRPENAPDAWETAALQAFEQGETVVSSVEEIDGESYMRLMRPLITEASCLQCHAIQGYKEGEIRGGISVAIPMEPMLLVSQTQQRDLMLGHMLLWLLGLGGLGITGQQFKRNDRERQQSENALRESLSTTRALYQASGTLIAIKDLPDLLQVVVDNLITALGVDRVTLIVIDSEAKQITQFVKGGPGVQHIEEIDFAELQQGLAGWVIREQKPVLSPKGIPDPRESPEVQRRRVATNSGDIVVVPLQYQNQIRGVLTAINRIDQRALTQQDVELMVALANQAAIAIENTRLVHSLRASEEKFFKVFRANPDPIVITSLVDGRYIDVNDSYFTVTGYTREDVIGRTSPELRIWHDMEVREQFLHLVQEYSAVHDFEMDFRKKSGEIGRVLMSTEIIDLDGEPCLLTVTKDITERKQAENALRESENQLRAIADNIPAYVAHIGLDDLCYRFVNSKFEVAFGMAREEIKGKHIREVIGEASYEFALPYIEQVRAGQMTSYENVFTTEQGERWIEANYVPDITIQGEVTGLFVLGFDITERKLAENRRMELRLERERTEILTNFIRQASHEFRTPLAAINTSSYILKKTMDNPQKQQENIAKIEDRVRDITTLVEALTTMSRLDSIRETPNETVDLCQMAQLIHVKKQTILRTRNLQCHLQIEARSLPVLGDPFDLQQAIECLVDNAIRFTPEAGTICVNLSQVEEMAVIRITDNGPGIGEKDMPHIFERFYRADKAGTTRGLGLGLPIAKLIVELYQGRIEVESAVGQGSTFTVILPLVGVLAQHKGKA